MSPNRTKPHSSPHWTLPVVHQGVLGQVQPLSSLGKRSSSGCSRLTLPHHHLPHTPRTSRPPRHQRASRVLWGVSNYCATPLLHPREHPNGLIPLSSLTHLHTGQAAFLGVFPILIPSSQKMARVSSASPNSRLPPSQQQCSLSAMPYKLCAFQPPSHSVLNRIPKYC